MSDKHPKAEQSEKRPKQAWVRPTIVDLPRLADLTLQTGIPGSGGTGDGGGTVF